MNKIVEFSKSCLLCCSIQFNFNIHDPLWFLLLILELLKGLFYSRKQLWKRFSTLVAPAHKVNAHVRPHFLILGYCWSYLAIYISPHSFKDPLGFCCSVFCAYTFVLSICIYSLSFTAYKPYLSKGILCAQLLWFTEARSWFCSVSFCSVIFYC